MKSKYVFRVGYNFRLDDDGKVDNELGWDSEKKTVVAADGEQAIQRLKKAVLSEVIGWTDDDGKKHKSTVGAFELTSLELLSSLDVGI